MNREEYRRPGMTVVEIAQLEVLMTSAKRKGYGKANQDVNINELDNDGNWNWD